MYIFENIIIFICFFIFFSCKENRRTLEWDIKVKEEKNNFSIDNIFHSNTDTTFLFDNKAFVVECYKEEDSLIKTSNNIKDIFQRISHNQIIIENKQGKMRFAYEFVYLDTNRVRSFYISDCILEWSDTVKLIDDIPFEINISLFDIEDIKVTKDDKKNRLHYLFKPDSIQREMGFKEFRITSNWFEIPQY